MGPGSELTPESTPGADIGALVAQALLPAAGQLSAAGASTDEVLPSGPRALQLSGSLGSGKTTLLNNLFTRSDQALGRFVVIENDIGEAKVDAHSLKVANEQVLALTAGCLCCKDYDSLKRMLAEIKAVPPQHRVDTIVLETTGVANPQTVRTLLQEANIPTCTLITLDVQHFERNLLANRLEGHLEAADVVLLTWWEGAKDLEIADQNKLARVVQYIEEERGGLGGAGGPKVVLLARSGEVMPFDMAALSGETAVPPGQLPPGQPQLMAISPGDLCADVQINHGTSTTTVRLKGDCSFEQLRAALAPYESSLLRVKGRVGDEVVQAVHGEWSRLPVNAREQALPHSVNVISTTKIPRVVFDTLRADAGSPALSGGVVGQLALRAAESVVRELVAQYPRDTIDARGKLLVNFSADEGLSFIDRAGFDARLRLSYLANYVGARLKAFAHYDRGEFDSDPKEPYYARRLGGSLSWALMRYGTEMQELQLHDAIRACKPLQLYFQGFATVSSPDELFKIENDSTVSFIAECHQWLVSECGSEREARELTTRALDNCSRLDESWRANRQKLNAAIGLTENDPTGST